MDRDAQATGLRKGICFAVSLKNNSSLVPFAKKNVCLLALCSSQQRERERERERERGLHDIERRILFLHNNGLMTEGFAQAGLTMWMQR